MATCFSRLGMIPSRHMSVASSLNVLGDMSYCGEEGIKGGRTAVKFAFRSTCCGSFIDCEVTSFLQYGIDIRSYGSYCQWDTCSFELSRILPFEQTCTFLRMPLI